MHRWPELTRDAFKETDSGKRPHTGATASHGGCGGGVRPDDGYRPDRVFVQRQHACLIFQKHDALPCGVKSSLAAIEVVARNREIGLIPVEPMRLHGKPQNSTHLVVD